MRILSAELYVPHLDHLTGRSTFNLKSEQTHVPLNLKDKGGSEVADDTTFKGPHLHAQGLSSTADAAVH